MFGMGTTLDLKDFGLILKPLRCLPGRHRPVFRHAVPGLRAGYGLRPGPGPDGRRRIGRHLPRRHVVQRHHLHEQRRCGLSVTMTMVSTVLSPILTPLITYWLIGQQINFSPIGMFFSIIQIVIVPIALGLAVQKFLPKLAETAEDYLPAVSSLAISLIIAGVIAVSRNAILAASSIIGKGRALGVGKVKFKGEVLDNAKIVRYEINLKKIIERGQLIMGIADGKGFL